MAAAVVEVVAVAVLDAAVGLEKQGTPVEPVVSVAYAVALAEAAHAASERVVAAAQVASQVVAVQELAQSAGH